MERKSVLICEYCGKVIDQEDQFVHDVERQGNQINHDAYYHQECFINSMIKDLEELGFEIIRPRSEINPNLPKSPFSQDDFLDLTPKDVDAAMKVAAPIMDAVFGQTNKISPDFLGDDPKKMKEGTITPKPKEDLKSKIQNGKEKSKKQSVGKRTKR